MHLNTATAKSEVLSSNFFLNANFSSTVLILSFGYSHSVIRIRLFDYSIIRLFLPNRSPPARC